MRNSNQPAIAFIAALLSTSYIACSRADAQTPPQELTKDQVRIFDAESEFIGGAFPGMLLTPTTRPHYKDEKYKRPYHLACHVYTAAPARAGSEPTFRRRFLVCAANEESLPFLRKVARLLLLLYSERHDRIGDDHPENLPTVNVWLTERTEPGLTADTGGEQFQNQIYLYDVRKTRSDIEWAREIAHEYGHYGLPGISGFREPEEWANGVLGERIFLKWIRDDLKTGRLVESDLSIVTGELLDRYYSTVIWPLVGNILHNGMDPEGLTSWKAAGMDYYTAFVMYIDMLYGTAVLQDSISDTRPASHLSFAHASDFLTGFKTALRNEHEIALRLPLFSGSNRPAAIHFFLPAGSWNIVPNGGVAELRVSAGKTQGLVSARSRVTIVKAGWYSLAYSLGPSGSTPPQIIFQKRE